MVDLLPKKLTKHITHHVNRVVYPFGDITDPITGKLVVAGKYRYITVDFFLYMFIVTFNFDYFSDEIEAKNLLFGKNPEGFDYSKAPERGWQKEKRDFSYQETYRKYHMFEQDDPYAV